MAKIWIIGASSGIGAALAQAYAAQEADLILSARDGAALNALACDCGGAQVVTLDLARPGAIAQAIKDHGLQDLDAVVCTAALYDPGRVAEIDPQALETLIRVNITATFALAQAAPQVLRHGGQLVLFGSVAGYMGLPRGQAYSASKAAIINLAESLRIEMAPAIDVRLVCPGFVRTRLTDKNHFTMPAIITPEEAASQIIKGLRGTAFEVHFPKRFTYAMKLLRALPYWLSLRLTGRIG